VTTRERGPPTEPALERLCRGRGRRLSAKRAVGFTLIEILVAVAILAVALAATTRAASLATDGTLETRQRLLATWAAQNRVAELRARRIFPATTASTRLSTEQGGMALVIDESVSDTPNPTIRRVDLAVADARDPNRVLTRLTAYVSQ
jgi:general secretion pathway protein I